MMNFGAPTLLDQIITTIVEPEPELIVGNIELPPQIVVTVDENGTVEIDKGTHVQRITLGMILKQVQSERGKATVRRFAEGL